MVFIARRLGFYVITAWVAITINFFIPRLMPGNPAELVFSRIHHEMSPAALHAFTVAFGVNSNQSLIGQYFSYVDQILHGNLGISITYFPATVSSVIRGALPWTLALVGVATVLSFALGTLLGMVAATRRGTWVDSLLPVTSFLSAVPYFWLGLVVLTVFAVNLGWFPLSGGYDPSLTPGFTWSFISSAVYHAVLPAVTIIVSSIAGWLLGMRNVMMGDSRRGLRAAGGGEGPPAAPGARSPTRRGTRSSPIWLASPFRSVSSSAGHSSPRSSSPTRSRIRAFRGRHELGLSPHAGHLPHDHRPRAASQPGS